MKLLKIKIKRLNVLRFLCNKSEKTHFDKKNVEYILAKKHFCHFKFYKRRDTQ